ncbi:MAG: sodium:calcium antiporter [Deltaproteobacteria bacterium]|nr:MAG: sodium:calcium antiporter [Deltaproteobacteria bacterium]
METLLDILLLFASIVLLWKGSDWLVESAARIGRAVGMSDLTIGLTIVAFGTSAPEFAVTLSAAITGRSDISVGNVVGSNIFNLGFILGGCALFRALKTSRRIVLRDGGLLIVVSLLLLYMLRDSHLSRIEGGVLLFGLFAYLVVLFYQRKETGGADEDIPTGRATWRDAPLFLAGLAGVIGGGHLLVVSASDIARAMGISEWVIAVTIVAAGTSAPEFATSLTAAAKGRHGMSLGNLIGSDLFNLFGVLGVAGLVRDMNVAPDAFSSVAMLVGMCVIVVVFMRTGWRISRLEGALLVAIGVLRWILDFLM